MRRFHHLAPVVLALVLSVPLLSARSQASRSPSPPSPRATASTGSRLSLSAADPRLVEAFDWARRQAAAYAFDEGDAAAPWFEAALPGREAFCMRDVSHQVLGAHALGLQRHAFNMLRRFAVSVTDDRDWCGLWEIDRHDRPAHADYRNDRDFWFNLPANFDVLDAVYRMYLWSDDPGYLTDPAFRDFAERTVTDYVARWKLAPDQVMTRPRLMNVRGPGDPDAQFAASRGIPGYNEETDDFTVGLDLLATEYAGFQAHARLLEARGDRAGARTWLGRAAELRAFVNRVWWDADGGGFFDRVGSDGRLKPRSPGFRSVAELYWPVADAGPHQRASVDRLAAQIRKSASTSIEEQSYHPEVLYRYGEPELAYGQIMDLARPDRARREYPEVPFAIVGAVVTGTFGVSVDPVPSGKEAELLEYFGGRFVQTLPQLTAATPWAELSHLPVRANELSIRHEGLSATTLANDRGPALVWRAAFPGAHETLRVEGVATKAVRSGLPVNRAISWVRVVVPPGQKVTVSVR